MAAQLFILEAIPLGVPPTRYAHLVPSGESSWAQAWYGERALRMARLGYLWQARKLLEIAHAKVDGNDGGANASTDDWEGTPLARLADKINDYCLIRRTLDKGDSNVPGSSNNVHYEDTARVNDGDEDKDDDDDGGEGESESIRTNSNDLLPPFREQMNLIRVISELPQRRRREVAPKLALNLKTIDAADRCTLWSWREGDATDVATPLPLLQRREWQRVTSLKEELLALRSDSLALRGRINRVMQLLAKVRELSRLRDRSSSSSAASSAAGSQESGTPLPTITLSTFQELSRYEEFIVGDLEELERLCIDELSRLSLEEGDPLHSG